MSTKMSKGAKSSKFPWDIQVDLQAPNLRSVQRRYRMSVDLVFQGIGKNDVESFVASQKHLDSSVEWISEKYEPKTRTLTAHVVQTHKVQDDVKEWIAALAIDLAYSVHAEKAIVKKVDVSSRSS